MVLYHTLLLMGLIVVRLSAGLMFLEYIGLPNIEWHIHVSQTENHMFVVSQA